MIDTALQSAPAPTGTEATAAAAPATQADEADEADAGPETLRDARTAYFDASGFDEGTYTATWVEINLGPIPFRFPNTRGRKKTVPLHDLHHALTGYSSKLRGEMQIASWEVGGGMRNHWDGWFLNLLTLSWGAVLFPRAALRAFVRGRRSVNFYQRDLEPDVLDSPVEEVRKDRNIAPVDQVKPARAGDIAAFIGWFLVSLPVAVIGYAMVPLMLLLGLWGAWSKRSATS